MNDLSIFKYIASILAGGGLATILNYFINRKKQNLSEFEILMQEHKDLRKYLNEKLEEYEKKIEILEIENHRLHEEIIKLKGGV